MADSKDEKLTPEDVRQWQQQEVFEVMRAAELRVKEATDLAMQYATRKITPDEVLQRMNDYDTRWSPAMVAGINETMNNAEILRAQDIGRSEEAQSESKWRDSLSGGTSPENRRG